MSVSKEKDEKRQIKTYKERNVSTRNAPDNIRQIGLPPEDRKVYIEDYVTSYINQQSKEKEAVYLVLLGKREEKKEIRSVYISGAIRLKDTESPFSSEDWENIYGENKKYFDDLSIVGWACIMDKLQEEIPEKLMDLHRVHFSGAEMMFLLYDKIEHEGNFYIRKDGHMCKQTGYYIYYEKNDAMKNYRMDHQNTPTEEQQYEDRVLNGVRKKMAVREQEKAKKQAYIIAGAGVVAATAVLFLFATMQNNLHKIKELESTIATMTEKAEGTSSVNVIGEKGTAGESIVEMENEDEGQDEDADVSVGLTEDSLEWTDKVSNKNKKTKNENEITGSGESGEGIDGDAAEDDSESSDTDEEADNGDNSIEKTEGNGKVAENNKKDDSAVKTEDGGASATPDNGVDTAQSNDESADTAVPASMILGYYTVKKGDTLSQISCHYYQTTGYVDMICRANDLRDVDTIYVGQVLVLPRESYAEHH